MARKYRFLSTLIAVTAMCLCLQPLASVAATVSDVDGHWAEEEIHMWLEKEHIQGYPDGTFRPNQSITRAEFVRLTNESMNVMEQSAVSFHDVPGDAWYYDDIAKAEAAGYIQGYEDGSFRPNEPISRQEVSLIIYTLFELEKTDADWEFMLEYRDAGEIPDWSADAIAALTAIGILSGYPDETFQPRQSMTRAETVFTLHRSLNILTTDLTIYDQAGMYGPEEGEDRENVEGDVVVQSSGVTLQNMSIQGDLILDKQVLNGEVTLRNIEVEGTTFVHGGGINSIYIDKSQLSRLVVDRAEGAVRIVASDTTEITDTELQSGAYLEAISGSENSYGQVIIDAPPNTVISLSGMFHSVIVNSPNVEVRLVEGQIDHFQVTEGAGNGTLAIEEGALVKTIEISDAFTVTGDGRIESAHVHKSDEVSFETTPDNMRETSERPPYYGGSGRDDEDPSDLDAEAVEDTKYQLTEMLIAGNNLDLQRVASDLNLPRTMNGTTISWSSDNQTVVNSEGVVNRPSFEEGDVSVTLTASIRKNQVEDTKIFHINVLSLRAELELMQQKQSDGSINVQALITASDIYAAEVHLTFDPNVVQIKGGRTDKGHVKLKTGDLFTSLPVAHVIDQEQGTVTFAGSLLGDEAGHHVADKMLFEFSYKPMMNEQVILSIDEEPILLTSKGERLVIR